MMRKTLLKLGVMLAVATFQLPALAAGKPNILVIMTDDMPTTDISAYHRGLGAVNTPNIDSIAKQGMMISDYYAEPSCTAGRAAFLTGQYPIRTGLTSVGQPGAPIGIQKEDPLIPELLKPQGYASAYFGKWHMGDRNEFIPTAHGFDEFYGFLYHLNVMNMPEQAEFPKDSKFPGRPRQVIHSFATDKDDPAEESRWGRVGKQKISYHGDLGRERQRTFDDEVMQYTQNWLKKTVDAKKPFFLVWAPTRMHQQVWVSEKYRGKSGHNQYNDGVLQLDDLVGQMLDSLEKLGVKNDTIVIFTSDNSVNLDHWPNSGSSMFRGQKGTTYDGGFRVPALVMWPGHIPAGEWTGEFFTSEDWLPTLLAMAGVENSKESLTKGMKVGGMDYKVHIDGYDQRDMLLNKGKTKRHEFFYYGDTDLNAIRIDQWKVHLATKDHWLDPLTPHSAGVLLDIKADPFERTIDTSGWFLWMKEKSWVLPEFAKPLAAHAKSFEEFPPRQKGSGLGLKALMSQMQHAGPKD